MASAAANARTSSKTAAMPEKQESIDMIKVVLSTAAKDTSLLGFGLVERLGKVVGSPKLLPRST